VQDGSRPLELGPHCGVKWSGGPPHSQDRIREAPGTACFRSSRFFTASSGPTNQ
jgi:hypothetical protein